MGIKKIEFVPAKKLPDEVRKEYKIQDGEFAEIRVVNPTKGLEIRRVKSPIQEVSDVFRKKGIRFKI